MSLIPRILVQAHQDDVGVTELSFIAVTELSFIAVLAYMVEVLKIVCWNRLNTVQMYSDLFILVSDCSMMKDWMKIRFANFHCVG